ncbi:MAG: hypothetical protein ACRCTS_03495 [Fusobacteriaceae bacterium]
MFNTNNTIDRITAVWGDPKFSSYEKKLANLISSNTLKLKFTNLTPERTYQWVIKPQAKLPNTSAVSADNFVVSPATTEVDIDIVLAEDFFTAGSNYFFGLREAGGFNDEGIQFSFEIAQNVVLATGFTVMTNLVGGDSTTSGIAFDKTTNKFVDQKSFENDIPLILNYVNGKIDGANLDSNTTFTTLKGRVSTAEGNITTLQTDKRNISDSYSRTEIDTKDSNVLTSANNYTNQEVGSLATATQTALDGKENTIIAGTISQYYRGDKTFQTLNTLAVPENTNLYFTQARVRSTPLTGFTATNNSITSTDTVLQAFGKAQGQINVKFNRAGGEITDQTYLRKAVPNANFPALVLANRVGGGDAANASTSITNLITDPVFPYTLDTNSLGSNFLTRRVSGTLCELIFQINNAGLAWVDSLRVRLGETTVYGNLVLDGGTLAGGSITNNTITNPKLAQMPANTLKGNNTGDTANPSDLTTAQTRTLLGTVNIDGNQNIAGVKTFTSPVGVANPEDDGDAVNRITMENADNEVINALPNGSLLRSYRNRSIALSGNPDEFQKINLQDSLNTFSRLKEPQPAYYLNAESAVLSGVTSNFVASGSSNINGTFAGDAPDINKLTTTTNGILGFTNTHATQGNGFNRSNFNPNNFNERFTVSAWLYFDSSIAVQRFVAYNTSSQARFEILSAGSEIRARAMSSGAVFIGRAASAYLSNANIYKITMVYEKDTDTASDVKIYGNGLQIDTTNNNAGAFTGVPATSTDNIEIGSYLSGANATPSTIFEVEMIPGVARSAGDELNIYNSQKSKYGL